MARAAVLPWGVQLAAGFSRDRVLAAYSRVTRRFKDVLRDSDPSICAVTTRSRGRGAFYPARVGAETRASADALCGKLRKAGGACMVLRNRQVAAR